MEHIFKQNNIKTSLIIKIGITMMINRRANNSNQKLVITSKKIIVIEIILMVLMMKITFRIPRIKVAIKKEAVEVKIEPNKINSLAIEIRMLITINMIEFKICLK